MTARTVHTRSGVGSFFVSRIAEMTSSAQPPRSFTLAGMSAAVSSTLSTRAGGTGSTWVHARAARANARGANRRIVVTQGTRNTLRHRAVTGANRPDPHVIRARVEL